MRFTTACLLFVSVISTGCGGSGSSRNPSTDPPPPPTPTITSVSLSPSSAQTMTAGSGITILSIVQGTGNFNQAVTWSISAGSAGTITPVQQAGAYYGQFQAGSTPGPVTVTATSVEDPTKFADLQITVISQAVSYYGWYGTLVPASGQVMPLDFDLTQVGSNLFSRGGGTEDNPAPGATVLSIGDDPLTMTMNLYCNNFYMQNIPTTYMSRSKTGAVLQSSIVMGYTLSGTVTNSQATLTLTGSGGGGSTINIVMTGTFNGQTNNDTGTTVGSFTGTYTSTGNCAGTAGTFSFTQYPTPLAAWQGSFTDYLNPPFQIQVLDEGASLSYAAIPAPYNYPAASFAMQEEFVGRFSHIYEADFAAGSTNLTLWGLVTSTNTFNAYLAFAPFGTPVPITQMIGQSGRAYLNATLQP